MRNKKKIASEETNQTVIMVESAESEEEPNLELNNMDQEETETETVIIDVEFENDSYLSGYLTWKIYKIIDLQISIIEQYFYNFVQW